MLASKKPLGLSPSNLPLQHLVDETDGSTQLYLGQQWLQPGDRVLDHTHPCEEILHFLSGTATVRLGKRSSLSLAETACISRQVSCTGSPTPVTVNCTFS
ncbi:MAG: hypothetical protein R2835_04860 [Thermomicrobiales bacterium]